MESTRASAQVVVLAREPDFSAACWGEVPTQRRLGRSNGLLALLEVSYFGRFVSGHRFSDAVVAIKGITPLGAAWRLKARLIGHDDGMLEGIP